MQEQLFLQQLVEQRRRASRPSPAGAGGPARSASSSSVARTMSGSAPSATTVHSTSISSGAEAASATSSSVTPSSRPAANLHHDGPPSHAHTDATARTSPPPPEPAVAPPSNGITIEEASTPQHPSARPPLSPSGGALVPYGPAGTQPPGPHVVAHPLQQHHHHHHSGGAAAELSAAGFAGDGRSQAAKFRSDVLTARTASNAMDRCGPGALRARAGARRRQDAWRAEGRAGYRLVPAEVYVTRAAPRTLWAARERPACVVCVRVRGRRSRCGGERACACVCVCVRGWRRYKALTRLLSGAKRDVVELRLERPAEPSSWLAPAPQEVLHRVSAASSWPHSRGGPGCTCMPTPCLLGGPLCEAACLPACLAATVRPRSSACPPFATGCLRVWRFARRSSAPLCPQEAALGNIVLPAPRCRVLECAWCRAGGGDWRGAVRLWHD